MIDLSVEEKNIWRIVQAVIQLIQGRSNAVGQVTLTPGATTTVVTKAADKAAVNVAMGSEILLSPRTSNAAAAIPTTWISNVEQGSFVISHLSAPSTDRVFGWEARG